MHGGLLTATAPANPAGVRPQTRITYSRKAITGGTLIWVPVSSSTCNTAASCAGTADETKVSVTYEPTHLLPSVVRTAAGDNSISSINTMAYDATGNLVTVDGPLAGVADTTTAFYDADRQVVGMIGADPDGAGVRKRIAQRTTYDPAGRALRQTTGTVSDATQASLDSLIPTNSPAIEQLVDHAFDANGRLAIEVTYGKGIVPVVATQYTYTADGLLDCAAVRMNTAVYGSLPTACAMSTAGSAGPDRISQTYYDALGRVVQLRTGVGTAAVVDETTGFTPNGQQAWVADGNGNKTSYYYDGHDRVFGMAMPDKATPGVSSTTDTESYNYDANGNLISQQLRDGTIVSYGFDALNRLVSRNAGALDGPMTFTYDNLGRRLTSTDAQNVTVAFSYDALGRQVAETALGRTMVSAYDAAGRRTKLTHADGFFVTYVYSVTGEMLQVRENGATSGVGRLALYTYDDLGRRTRLTRGNGLVTDYAFDPASRLQQLGHTGVGLASTKAFSYNPAGEITQASQSNAGYDWRQHQNIDSLAAVNGLNQLTQVGGNAFSYDRRGNLIADGEKTFSYNSRNQLVGYTGGGLYYDPVGRLTNLSAEAQQLTYDGSEMTAEYSYAGAMQRRYVHGAGVDEPLVWYEGVGTADRRFYHADERGSIVALSNSAGQEVAKLTYDEYGNPGTGNVGRFQYTGQKWIASLGAYDYKARIYSPRLGRFLQTDPIGYGDGLNLYSYVGGDPVNGRDPSGLIEINCTAPSCYKRREDSFGGWGGFGGFGGWGGGGAGGGNGGEVVGEAVVITGQRPPRQQRPPTRQPTPGLGMPQRDECAFRTQSGQCALVRDDKGKLRQDPDYAKKACQNYKSMMAANRNVALGNLALSVPGTANAGLGGTVGWLSKTAGVIGGRFMTFARGVVGLTTGLLAWGGAYSAPEGCK